MKTISWPGTELPVIKEKEVIVVGGGPGGIPAAIAAARNGMDTLLIERYGFLGGMATAGLMTSVNGFRNEKPPNDLQTVRGIAQEIIQNLHKLGGTSLVSIYFEHTKLHQDSKDIEKGELPYAVGIDPELMKYVALKMVKEAGVDILLHTFSVEAIVDEEKIKGVIVVNKSGRRAVLGKIIIDATGDADIAASAGATYYKADKQDPHFMPMSLMFRLSNVDPGKIKNDPRGILIDNSFVSWGPTISQRDGTDAEDLTAAEIEAREKMIDTFEEWRKCPGMKNVYLTQTATTIGVRETRRIVGEYMLTEKDALEGKRFKDVIAVSVNPVPSYYGKRYFFNHEGFDIPYRSLVPQKVENLIVSGRCISAEPVPFQSARSMAPAMAIGQAAGAAAALSVKGKVTPRDLDISKLQETLLRQNAELRLTKK